MLAQHSKQMGQYIGWQLRTHSPFLNHSVLIHDQGRAKPIRLLKPIRLYYCSVADTIQTSIRPVFINPRKFNLSQNDFKNPILIQTHNIPIQWLTQPIHWPIHQFNLPSQISFFKSLIPTLHQTLYSTPNSILQEEVGGNVSLQWLHLRLLHIQNITTVDVSFTQRMHRCLYTNFIFSSRSSHSTSQSHW